MTLTQLAPPFPIFTDRDGSPLDAGYLYFGEVNQNPETNPIQIYYDNAFTIPAAQPLRTSNGYVMRNGSPALVFADSQFSVTVRNKKSELVIYSPVGYGMTPGTSVSSTDQMTYNESSSGAVDRVLTSKLQEFVSVKDFGAVGDGVTDDTAAIQLALDVGGRIYIPDGIYLVGNKTTVGAEVSFFRVKNNTLLFGSRSAIIKVAPNVGDYTAVFVSATTYGPGIAENVQFDGFTIDQDAAANTTCNITPGVVGKACAAIIFLRRHKHIYVENMAFLNAPGVNTVSLNGPLSVDAKVNGNRFEFLAGNSTIVNGAGNINYDNSLVYIESNGFECNDNWAYNTTVTGAGTYTGGRTAYELHGGNGTICRNHASRFATLANVVGFLSGQDIVPLNNLVVNENTASECRSGIALWSITGTTLEGFEVNENLISLDPTKFDENGSTASGITFITDVGVSGVYRYGNILNNIIKYDGDLTSSVVADRSAGISIDTEGAVSSVTVKGNQIYNSPCIGLSVYQQIGAFDRINVRDNFIYDAGLNSLTPIRIGVLWRGTITNSQCDSNTVVDTGIPNSNVTSGTSTQFVGASSTIVATNNVAKSASSTPVRNFYSAYDTSSLVKSYTASGSIVVLNPELGITDFFVNCTVTSFFNLAITTALYPVASGESITVNIKNTSGGTTNIAPTASFSLSAAFVNLTAGQQCSMKFTFDAVAQRWYQTGPQVTVAS